MPNLDKVHDALSDIASYSSRNSKIAKLKFYLDEEPVKWLRETIIYALHPHKHFYINKIPFKRPVAIDGASDIFGFLDYLTKRKGATNVHRDELTRLSSSTAKTNSVVNKILKKDLRCGVQIKTARKFIPEIPLYEVMKAIGDNPFPGKEWEKFVERCGGYRRIVSAIKMDGYRVSYCTVFENGEVEYLSTSGKPYVNFSPFDDEMVALASNIHDEYGLKYPMKFDGECISKDGNFQTMQKHARRESNIDSEIYRFLIWDVICDYDYSDRFKMLSYLTPTSGELYDLLRTVKSNPDEKVFRLMHWFTGYVDTQAVVAHAMSVIRDGNEGLVFKTPNHRHEFKRSKHWFKLKALYLKGMGIEIDLPVVGFNYGKKGTRMEKLLGAFLCEYKGHPVSVSGKMSDSERLKYVKDLPSFIEVHADSETDDGSLRLPIFQRARYDK